LLPIGEKKIGFWITDSIVDSRSVRVGEAFASAKASACAERLCLRQATPTPTKFEVDSLALSIPAHGAKSAIDVLFGYFGNLTASPNGN
jgi:hypothetical protein